MGFTVIITPTATDDLEQIARFISRDSPSRAEQFGNALIDRAHSVASFPEAGRMLPGLGDPTVREIFHGQYRIIYEIRSASSSIYILRFWHAARGTPEIPDLET